MFGVSRDWCSILKVVKTERFINKLFISISMNLHNPIKDFGKKIIVAGSLVAILAGCSQPTLNNKDLTGDNIPDAIVDIKYGLQNGTWLFIGQEDGSFVRAKQYEHTGVKYFKTDDGTAYFFDGEFYKPSPKQE